MKRWLLICCGVVVVAVGMVSMTHAQTADDASFDDQLVEEQTTLAPQETLFRARVAEVLEERREERPGGTISIQQRLELIGLEDPWQGKTFEFSNLGLDVVDYPGYRVGDRVMVYHSQTVDGLSRFYIADALRAPRLWWPAVLFALLVVLLGRWKGVRALVGLVVSFAVILYGIIPAILRGYDPLLVTIIGTVVILLATFLFTYGWHRKSIVALVANLIALLVIAGLSWLFTVVTKLTGFGSEETMFLISLAEQTINIRGLLLAGMVIGAIGVLNDATISQASVVEELVAADPTLTRRQLFTRSMRVGVDHITSMVDTLSLAYAGSALPLLILFTMRRGTYLTFGDAVNTEVIAVEIVRMLVGSIGLMIAVPVTSFLAVVLLRPLARFARRSDHSHYHH